MSTYPALVPATEPLIPAASAVKAQFDNPPDLETLVRSMLNGALVEKYPTLIINLQRTQLAVPRLTVGWDLEPFMPTVLAYLGSGTGLDFTPVTTSPITCAMTHRPGSRPLKASWTWRSSRR